MRRPLSSMHPLLYHASVIVRRSQRRIAWLRPDIAFAHERAEQDLPCRVYKHQSVLVRKMGDSGIQLQLNKVENLKLAIAHLDGVLIRPNETFSFWRLVGKPSKSKGYLEAMLLSNGEAVVGTGGGLCQIANLINWMLLHSPLTITERHHHSFDPFPDCGRVLPFGSGATIFYNYLDYQFTNRTEYTFQLRFWLDQKCINGDLRINEALPYVYHVYEKNHHFTQKNNQYYRHNEIWRYKLKRFESRRFDEELMIKNDSLVKYQPTDVEIANCDDGGQP